MNTRKIVIFGAGYVGLTTAVLLANSGYATTLIEISPERLASLQKGKSFFYEQGINELLQKALKDKTLSITNDPTESLQDADILFSCVGTPDQPDGSSNLRFVFDVAATVAKHAQDDVIFVQKSTVPVGTGGDIEQLFKKAGKSIHYVSNPEFLREGTAVLDSLYFDRVVVGGPHKQANEVADVYRTLESHQDELADIVGVQPDTKALGEYIVTNRNSAELTKVTANAFLALKISFANSIAKLADKSGADVVGVMDAVGTDRRIGRAFLDAGRGYGGGCFPKDVSGLISSANEHGIDMPIMLAATDVNESMPGYIATKAKELLNTYEGKNVAVLGLSFKPGTSDARKSPGVKLANILRKSGATVTTYDPHANGEAREDLHAKIQTLPSLDDAVAGVDAVFITTKWDEFVSMDLEKLASNMKGIVCIDAMNCLNPSKVRAAGLHYYGVGRSNDQE